MIKMNGKSKNNLNFSKEMSLNIKTSTKTRDTFFKTNNASLDFASSPIKNNKKVIKRNTRTNSYNSFLYNQTENILTSKNPFNSGIISVDSSSKINLKKNIFTFSNTKQTLGNNSKNKNNNNNNTKKNKKSKPNIKSKNKSKNITAHQSTSNLAKFNININSDNNFKKSVNNSNEYVSVNTNPNIASRFILNKKKNTKISNHSHFEHSNLLSSNDFNYIKDNNFYSFYLQEKPEKEKLYFRNNNTTKNLLFLTRQNMRTKKYQEKNKTSIYKNAKQNQGEPIFYSNKKCLDFNFRDINSNLKAKKNFKNLNPKTTKNSEDKKRNKLNINRFSNNIINNNLLELSSEEPNNELMKEYELLYNCLKKRSDTCNRAIRSKSGRKEKNNKKRKKYELFEENILSLDSLLGIIYENKQIKQKNEELSKQFENFKKEFEQMKKDNKFIKEVLKEKTKYLKDIKLTMDIFTQELLKLQSIFKENENNNNTNNSNNNKSAKNISSNKNMNTNLNLNNIENESNNNINNKENPKFIIEVNTKSKINNDNNYKVNNLNNNTNNINNNVNNNIIISKESKDNNDYIYETDINTINNNINNNYLPKRNKLEKIHQLSLNDINNLFNQQNKKRGGSLEGNFQDTSKIINNETKDTTEKDNECLNDKWPNPLYEDKDKDKKLESKEISKEDKESIDLTNISLADNLNINEEVYNNAINSKKNNIGKLDFKNKLKKNNDENDKMKKIPKQLNFINQSTTNDNFNDEFLKYYDKFSDSWRKEVDKMLKKGNDKK